MKNRFWCVAWGPPQRSWTYKTARKREIKENLNNRPGVRITHLPRVGNVWRSFVPPTPPGPVQRTVDTEHYLGMNEHFVRDTVKLDTLI